MRAHLCGVSPSIRGAGAGDTRSDRDGRRNNRAKCQKSDKRYMLCGSIYIKVRKITNKAMVAESTGEDGSQQAHEETDTGTS